MKIRKTDVAILFACFKEGETHIPDRFVYYLDDYARWSGKRGAALLGQPAGKYVMVIPGSREQRKNLRRPMNLKA